MSSASDASLYAHYVFNAFDSDRSGTISFEVSIRYCEIFTLPSGFLCQTECYRFVVTSMITILIYIFYLV